MKGNYTPNQNESESSNTSNENDNNDNNNNNNSNNTLIELQTLDWENVTPQDLQAFQSIDIIIAADVVCNLHRIIELYALLLI